MVPREASNIPGVIVVGELSLAEELNWPIAGLRKAFKEISDAGMAEADWKSKLVFLPNAIKYHVPESMNVITSWRDPWDEVPECDLKRRIHGTLRSYIQSNMTPVFLERFDTILPEAFGKAFHGVLTKDIKKALRKGIPKEYGESGAVAGAVVGTGTGTLPVPIHIPNSEISSVRKQAEPKNGTGRTDDPQPDFQKFWGPVEKHLRKGIDDEVFQKFYAGIRVLDMNARSIVLAVPAGLIERNGNSRDLTAVVLAHSIEHADTNFLRDRELKIFTLSEATPLLKGKS